MEQINEELLYALSECQSLDQIKVTSLRAKGLNHCLKTLSKCQNLTILYLQFNSISFEDLSQHLMKFKFLLKLDLSFNHIKNLPDKTVFQNLYSLKVLYLHNNLLAEYQDLTSLSALPSINHITLFNNYITKIPSYRHFLVNATPSLLVLDEYIITDEERLQYTSIGVRFRALSLFMKISVPDFEENILAEQHIFNLDVHLYSLRRQFERNSPSIRIQAYYRGFSVRKNSYAMISQKRRAALVIQKCARRFLFKIRAKKELYDLLVEQNLEHLMFDQLKYKQYQAVQTIGMAYKNYLNTRKRAQQIQNFAIRIQKNYKAAMAQSTSFIDALNLRNDSRIYILREQKLDFFKVLKKFCKKFGVLNQLKALQEMIKPCNDYMLIRYPNPLTHKRHTYPILSLCTPSNISKIKKNKPCGQIFGEKGTLRNVYTRTEGSEVQKKQLSILKNRLSNANKSALKIINFLKQNNEYQRAKYQWDQYQEFLIFDPKDCNVTIEVCKIVIERNCMVKNEQILLYFPLLIERIASATKIQQFYRSYKIEKTQKSQLKYFYREKQPLYNPCELLMTRAVIQRRAAIAIQQTWKYYKLKMRLIALKQIKDYFVKLNSKTLYVEESLYNMIPQIIQQNKSKLKFIEQNLDFDFKSNESDLSDLASTQQTQEKSDEEQEFYIFVNNLAERTLRFDRNPFPKWLQSYCGGSFNGTHTASQHFNDLMGIFHKASQKEESQVKDYNQLVEVQKKNIFINNGLKFVSMNCDTIIEAKKRALVLAFITYSIKQRVFLKLFTAEQLSQGIFLRHVQWQWQSFGLPDSAQRMSILLQNGAVDYINLNQERDLQQQNPHQGFLLSYTGIPYFQNNLHCYILPIQKEIYLEQEKQNQMNQYWYIVQFHQRRSLKKMIEVEIDNQAQLLNESSQELESVPVVLQQTYKKSSKNINGLTISPDMEGKKPITSQRKREIVTAPQSVKTGGITFSSRKNSQKKEGQAESFIFGNRISAQASSNHNQQDILVEDEENKNEHFRSSQGYTWNRDLQEFKSFGSQQIKSIQQKRPVFNLEVDFKDLKEKYKMRRYEETQKQRSINLIIKSSIKEEKELLQKELNEQINAEKEMRKTNYTKQKFRLTSEQNFRKQSVENHVFTKRIKEKERDFANLFSQMRNLITNSTKSGELKRLKTNRLRERQSVVEILKSRKQSPRKASGDYSQLLQKQFDTNAIQPQCLQNSRIRQVQSAQVSPIRQSNMKEGRVIFRNIRRDSEQQRSERNDLKNQTQLVQRESSQSVLSNQQELLKMSFQKRLKQFTKNDILRKKDGNQFQFIQEGFPTVMVPQIQLSMRSQKKL